jgi:hypothetical protein
MREVILRIIETGQPKKERWTTELWEGVPGDPNPRKIAEPAAGETYTREELERPTTVREGAVNLCLTEIQTKIQTDNNPNDIFRAVGLRLFELLEKTGVGRPWREAREEEERLRDNPGDGRAPDPQAGLRTYLELPDTLSQWPWELLAWQDQPEVAPVFAFNDRHHPIVRFIHKDYPRDHQATVRILLVAGQRDLSEVSGKKLLAIEELRRIRKAFQAAAFSVIVELCESPKEFGELEKHIIELKPHVIHIVGHGTLENGEMALKFQGDGPEDKPWFWEAPQIPQFFRSHWKPRLVVLNVCHAGEFNAGSVSLSRSLVDAGIPAVIASQAALTVEYAREFATAFYEELTRNPRPLESKVCASAMCEARRKLSVHGTFQGLDRRHWALPVLTLSCPMGRVLRLTEFYSKANACPLIDRIFKRTGRFVNRTRDRWKILSAFNPPAFAPAAQRVLVVQGERGTGKQWLVLRTIRDFLDAGFLVRYALLTCAGQARTSLDVLRDWRDNKRHSYLNELGDEHFKDFDAAMLEARDDLNAAVAQRAFAEFKAGLQLSRGNRKVLLILDRLQQPGIATVPMRDFQIGLMNHIFLPLQGSEGFDTLKEVYALIVARPAPYGSPDGRSDFELYGLNQLSFIDLKVKYFDSKQLGNYLDEFLEFSSSSAANTLRVLLEQLNHADLSRGSPGAFDEEFDKMVMRAKNLPEW